MKMESPVIVSKKTTVNSYSNLVHTARHALGIGSLKARASVTNNFTNSLLKTKNVLLILKQGDYGYWGEVVTG